MAELKWRIVMAELIHRLLRKEHLPWVLGAVFCGAGLGKLFGARMWVEGFLDWGYPPWLRLLLGWVEVTAGAMLPLGRMRGLVNLLLGLILVGAMATHVRMQEYAWALVPASLLVLLALVTATGWGRTSGS